jgi:ribonuclease J
MSKIKIFSLGGLNEEGKNMYVVEVDNDIFVFDAGLKYADERMLGIDYIIPNTDYLMNNIDRVKGIFITHAHDENMGAIVDVVNKIKNIKIYATKFTMEMIRKELEEENVKHDFLYEIKAHQKISFGQNSIFPISLTHSVPDTVGYVLYTNDGAIFYTGDFTFDWTMDGSYQTDVGKLAYVGKQGVLCLLSESLYSEKLGHTSPNHRISSVVRETLLRNENRVIFAIFSSNIHRVQEIFNEIMKTERKVVVMGKRLQNIIAKSIDMNYINFPKDKIGDLNNINDKDIVILISDEREKPFNNLSRISNGYDKYIKIKDTDTVFITEPISDSIEKTAIRVADDIARMGANIVTLSPKKHLLYHPSKEDLMLMMNLINPKYYMPVIGEYRYMYQNAVIASELGMNKDNIILKQNGDIAEFDNGVLIDNFDKINVEDVLIDGKNIGDIGELVLKDREILRENGIMIICATVDKRSKKILAGPEVLTRGFIYVKENADLIKEVQRISLGVINNNTTNNYVDYNKIRMGIREELGNYLFKETECKPMIITVIQEI